MNANAPQLMRGARLLHRSSTQAPGAIASSKAKVTPVRTPAAPSLRSLATHSSTVHAPELGSPHVASSLFAPLDSFQQRHLGPREADVKVMLEKLGYNGMAEFVKDSVPTKIRLHDGAISNEIIKPLSESELLRRGEEIAKMNKPFKSLIGMGYHNSLVPPVILRNVSGSLAQTCSGR